MEEILNETRREVEHFMKIEGQITTGLEYEQRVIEICRSLGKKLMQGGYNVDCRGKNSKKN